MKSSECTCRFNRRWSVAAAISKNFMQKDRDFRLCATYGKFFSHYNMKSESKKSPHISSYWQVRVPVLLLNVWKLSLVSPKGPHKCFWPSLPEISIAKRMCTAPQISEDIDCSGQII